MTSRRSLEQWEVLIKEMRESGVAHKQWCETQGINYLSLKNAQTRLKKQAHVSADKLQPFIGVEFQTSAQTEISLSYQGISITASPKDAVTLLKHLAADLC